MRIPVVSILLAGGLALLTSCVSSPERLGLAYAGSVNAENVQLLVDETWVDETGTRRVDQEIYNSVFDIIDEAEDFIILDFFLVNDFLYEPGPGMRPLSRELTERLIEKRSKNPDVEIVFITDPINRIYGSLEAPYFEALREAGVNVVWTDLDQLRDSNPVYSKPWRLLIKPWGIAPGKMAPNPLTEGRMSLRSFLKMINFKANHRKLIATEKSLLVTSANPHSASSAHWNVALRVDGAGMGLAYEAEAAIMHFSGASDVVDAMPPVPKNSIAKGGHLLELLTEKRVKEKVLEMLGEATSGMRIDLSMFYLSDRDVIEALLRAEERGCCIRVILDPNKDAFGRTKNGIPNRQSAARLVGAEVPLRWASTHGEQFHVKMLYVQKVNNESTLLLGSSNYTRRNLDNFNAECCVAFTAPWDHTVMVRARNVFDRWWSNSGNRIYTENYSVYADSSSWRRFRAWFMEVSGWGTF